MLKLLRALLFLLLLFGILGSVQFTLSRKNSEKKMRRFFEEKAGFDVLFTGISHTKDGIYPMEMFGEYGIAAFNLGESSVTLPYAYWSLRLALQYCTPKLVVIDVRRMDIENTDAVYTVMNEFDAFPLTLTKLRAAFDLYDDLDDLAGFALPLVDYHERWALLTKGDFVVRGYNPDNGARHYPLDKLKVYPGKKYPKVEDDDSLPGTDFAVSYLRKMIELCKERGIEVLLEEAPFPATEEDQRYANGVQEIADAYGVHYINYHHADGILNFKTDLYNADHTNDSGARKISYDLGAYIMENYDIPDRREDPAYADWQASFAAYVRYKERRIKAADTPEKLLLLLMDRHMDVRIRIREGSYYYDRKRIMNLIRNICPDEELPELERAIGTKQEYRAYLCSGKGVVAESADGGVVSALIGGRERVMDASTRAMTSELEVYVYHADTGEKFARIFFD